MKNSSLWKKDMHQINRRLEEETSDIRTEECQAFVLDQGIPGNLLASTQCSLRTHVKLMTSGTLLDISRDLTMQVNVHLVHHDELMASVLSWNSFFSHLSLQICTRDDDGRGDSNVCRLALLRQLNALIFVDSASSFARGCGCALCCWRRLNKHRHPSWGHECNPYEPWCRWKWCVGLIFLVNGNDDDINVVMMAILVLNTMW